MFIMAPESTFKVIGCGLSRTGTTSLKAALELLLGGPCYHAWSITEDTDNPLMDFWIDVLKGEDVTDEQIREELNSRKFVGGLDLPVSNLYKRLMQAFPEAKVILTVRDPEAWYTSAKINCYDPLKGKYDTLYCKIFFTAVGRPHTSEFLKHTMTSFTNAFHGGKKAALQFYESWAKDVKETVPDDRLLIYDVRQGWEPLCKFLEKPIPDVPFPRLNDTAALQGKIQQYRRKTNLAIISGITLCVTVVAAVMSYAF